MDTLPLVSDRAPDDVLAWRPQGPATVRDYCAAVQALAQWLPPSPAILNLCEDRYRYAVLLGACAVSGRVSLQPSSLSAQTLQQLMQSYPGAIAVSDAGSNEPFAVPTLRLPEVDDLAAGAAAEMPLIPVDRVFAVLFTSGSTGQPQACPRVWRKAAANGRANAAALGLLRRPHVLFGTIPAQHAYGFETTVLPTLHGGCAFWSGKPFYPQDLAEALAATPEPRMVATTPFQFDKFMSSGVQLPRVDQWLSATAPLDADFAARVEAQTGATVYEIYGATESASIATRHTSEGASWTPLAGVRLEQEGDVTWVCGGHISERVPLGDIIHLEADGRFTLHGRHSDMIHLAGKRSSLAFLNHQLCALDGVRDACFYLPNDSREGGSTRVTRLVAFAVAPGCDKAALLAGLRERIDPAFMPRPLVLVDALPRNATDKLTRDALEQLYQREVRRA